MKLLFKVLLCSMLMLALIGCKKADSPSSAVAPKAPSSALNVDASKVKKDGKSAAETEKIEKVVDSKRKLIKEGEIRFETSDIEKTTALIRDAVKEANGYIAKETQDKQGERARISVVIRVPQYRFDDLVKSIVSNVETLDSKNINTKDVTEEYVDLQARIRTRLSVENRYRQLLSQANKMDDILKIERQLAEIREEIEAAEGKLKYLSDRSEFSTFTVVYYQRVGAARGFGLRMADGFQDGWSYFAAFIVGLVHIWPFIVFVIVALVVAMKYRKKKPETAGAATKGPETKDQSQ